MTKILLAPDSFKHNLSAIEICHIGRSVIEQAIPEAEVIELPIADGGEGTVDTLLNIMGGEKVPFKVQGPWQEAIDSFFGWIEDDATAVIEMAAAAGLPLVGERLDPSSTTTYGVGQLIGAALDKNCRRIILGLGGSATNDAGCGAVAALGARFFDAEGQAFLPVGASLDRIHRIELSGLDPRLKTCEIIAICDIASPLYGERGAAYLFGPQKGADADMVRLLDEQLRAFAAIVKRELQLDVAHLDGAGAAGGLGAGAAAFLAAKLCPGIDTILDLIDFNAKAEKASFIITGEGRLDGLTMEGKAVYGIARRGKQLGIPVFAVVGDIGEGSNALYKHGVTAILSTNRRALPWEEARKSSREDLEQTFYTLMRLLQVQLFQEE